MFFRVQNRPLWLAAFILFWAAFPALGKEISFDRDIRPILSDNCFHCHGPDAKKRKAQVEKLKAAPYSAISVQAVLPICNQEGILIEKDQERQP